MIRTALAVVAMAVAVLAAPEAHAGDPAAGKAKAEAAGCVACHGTLGVSDDALIPNLAGQNEAYLIKQLTEFRRAGGPSRKAGARRSDHVMDRQAALLTEADIDNLAAWFTTLWCGSSGREIADAGPKRVARCTGCHGPSGMSTEDEIIPKLAGQKHGYLAKQLALFRESAGGRPSADDESERFHPLMDTEAQSLTDADIEALAAYFAGQSCW